MTTILRKYHSVARCTLLGEMIEDTAHRYYYRPHVGGELTFVDKEFAGQPPHAVPSVPDWPPPTTRQRRRDELTMTLTLVIVGLVLAPPTGWLLAAWLCQDFDFEALNSSGVLQMRSPSIARTAGSCVVEARQPAASNASLKMARMAPALVVASTFPEGERNRCPAGSSPERPPASKAPGWLFAFRRTGKTMERGCRCAAGRECSG